MRKDLNGEDVFAYMDKVAISVGDASKEIPGCALLGQQPVVQFDNDDGELIDPIRIGGEQIFFSALDIDFGDEWNKAVRDLRSYDARQGFAFHIGRLVVPGLIAPFALAGVDQCHPAFCRADGAMVQVDIQVACIQVQQFEVVILGFERHNMGTGKVLLEPAYAGPDIRAGIDNQRPIDGVIHFGQLGAAFQMAEGIVFVLKHLADDVLIGRGAAMMQHATVMADPERERIYDPQFANARETLDVCDHAHFMRSRLC
ncbi:MAG TPA: hypothetical protein VHC39_08425 [Rhizomicrobium sp.]|nr:hypothetical protein [Rhizomicrobium sp.]